MSGLNIKKDGALDLVSLGALVNRLDPGIIPFRKATECKIYVSGGEFNVAANLADCFGMKTGIVSAMVDYPIGDLIAERVRAMGVKPFYKHFKHNGVNGPNMATVYSDQGHGVRPPMVFYNRSNEGGALLKPGDFNWDEIFAGGIRWFHSGGIFAALSETTGELIIEGMKAAKKAGAVIFGVARKKPLRLLPASWKMLIYLLGTKKICKRDLVSPVRMLNQCQSLIQPLFSG